jgi:hypothetical protein
MFLIGEQIQIKLLKEILEVMGILTFQIDGKSQTTHSNDDPVASSICYHLEAPPFIHGRYDEIMKCVMSRIIRLTVYLREGIRTPNNKKAMNVLMGWICSTPDQMAYMIIESCIDVLYHICTHPGGEQLKENLVVLIFIMVYISRRLEKTQTISPSSAFKLHHIVDHILRTETEKSIRLSVSLLIDVFIQMKPSF